MIDLNNGGAGMTTIYALVDKNTQEPRYIGKTCGKLNNRLLDHIKRSKSGNECNYKASWLKSVDYQVEIISVEIVGEDWAEAESWWIEYFKFMGARLTNLTSGGEGMPGFVPSVKTRKIWSAQRKGRVPHNKGVPHSEETKRKISEIQKGCKHHMYGKSISEETKLKMSLSQKGIPKPHTYVVSEDQKRKISDSNRKRWAERKDSGYKSPPKSEEFKKMMSEKAKFRHRNKKGYFEVEQNDRSQ